VGFEMALQIAKKYDREILILLLVIIYNRLTPTPYNVEPLDVVFLELGVFSSLTSMKEVAMAYLKLIYCFINKLKHQVKILILRV
jgi:hypothetical protein